ncbi:MAG: VCBS repeat-containing protein [Desulfovibrio sp.]|nr:VCBS repeat-containing protein [Desulfovibrio sp.]
MKPCLRLSLALCLAVAVLCLAGAAPAAQPSQKSFVIAPFAVNAPQSYSYLAKAVPGTIQGKLNRPGTLEGKSLQGKALSAAEARKALSSSGADYAVFGTINVMGNDCVIELNCVDKAGKTWSRTAESPVSGLTGAVQNLSSALGSEVMGVTVAAKPAFMTRQPGQTAPAGARPTGDIVVNETGQQQTYLNPQLRYQGAGTGDGSRLRSQRIKENMVDMAVADFNGDGKNEIAFLGDHSLTIYLWEEGGRLKQLGTTTVSASNLNFSMRAMDLNRDGAADLVIATFEEDSNRPYSYFYSFKGNKLSQCAERIPYFASVLRTPPNFTPTLVGQAFDSIKLFAPGVHQLVKSGNRYSLGARISLPSGANVFNVAWIPAGKDNSSDMLAMLTDDERIKLFQANGTTPVHTTMERFSGSATGMDFYKTMPGLGTDKTGQLPGKIYAPMRMIAADLGRTGEHVLMLNKPISTASQFFDRYRFFPQGEIHALYWDGVGLALKWKTRRIRGSVAEIDLADVTNDGIIDLVVGVNTSPELGIGSRQSMILAYPLDVSQMDPNTPADMSDFEVNPNR